MQKPSRIVSGNWPNFNCFNMNNKAAYQLYLFQNIFKIFLIISTFGMSVHCANLLFGINICIVELTIILSLVPFAILYMCTYILKLCVLSRSILIYNYVVSQCIYVQKNYQLFGEYLTPARWIVMVSGLVIVTLLIQKMYEHSKQRKPCTR